MQLTAMYFSLDWKTWFGWYGKVVGCLVVIFVIVVVVVIVVAAVVFHHFLICADFLDD